ncbi:MAG: EF-hand domain-containing protein [Alphaproteobacteria bacterium]|nr:EF-hand domain-containing protein [Alphaproteobacteria bacterium]
MSLFAALLLTISAGSLYAQQATEQTEVKCDTAYQNVDTNDDGRISKDEAEQALDRSFQKLDFDNDGEVTKAEYLACHKYSELFASDISGYDWLASADSDKDNVVTREEAAQSSEKLFKDSSSGMSREQHARQTAFNFSQLDKNSNGKLEKSEWNGTPVAPEALPADDNNDGAIQADEWQAHVQKSQQEAQAKAEKTSADAGSANAAVGQENASASQDGKSDEPTVWLYYLYSY